MERLKVISFKNGTRQIEEIENNLKPIQDFVGGYFDVFYIFPNVVLVYMEDKINGVEDGSKPELSIVKISDYSNRVINIFSSCFIVGVEKEDFRSLTDAELDMVLKSSKEFKKDKNNPWFGYNYLAI